MVGLRDKLSHANQVLAREMSDTLIVLNLENGHCYSLNESGKRIWQLCDGMRTIAEIVSVVCDEYGAPAARVEEDVLALIEELAEERLVHATRPLGVKETGVLA